MRLALASVLAGLAIAAPLASAGPQGSGRPHISWADTQHRYGWALSTARTKGGWCPSRYSAPRVCATEDGGKHWHGILYATFDRAIAVVRSTERAGVVDLVRGDETAPLVTLDNGRHWYLLSRMFGAQRVWVKRGRVYWKDYANVYRLSGWPNAKVRASCSIPGLDTVWAYGYHATGPRANVCWSPTYDQPEGIVRGVSKTLIKAPDRSIVSWADKKHAFATDPAGAKWRCAPPGARGYVVTLCGTNNGGKSWWIAYSQEWKRRAFDSLVAILGVWRGPAKDGAFDLLYEADGFHGDAVYVTHDGGGNWEETDAFFAGLKHACDPDEPDGTVCAGGVSFHQDHGTPLQLVYTLNVCTAPFAAQCETRTYRMDGWPDGPLTPVQLSP